MLRLLLVLALMVSASSASAATRYLSTAGNDTTNSCAASQTVGTAKRNFNGANGALACMASGDTLIVKAGTYVETIVVGTIPAGGGSWATATKIQAAPGETVWLRPSSANGDLSLVQFGLSQTYIELTAINLDGALTDAAFITIYEGDVLGGNQGHAHHIRWQDSEWKGAPAGSGHTSSHGVLTRSAGCPVPCQGGNEFLRNSIHGIGPDHLIHGMYLTTPNDIVDGNDFYDITGSGVQIQSGPANPYPTIRNNKFHDPRTTTGPSGDNHWGIVISYTAGGGGTTALIYNNLFYNINNDTGGGSFGIHNFSGGATSDIYNNTCYNVQGYCYLLNAGTNNFRNNIAYAAGTNYSDATTGTKSNNTTDGTNPNFASTTPGDPNFLKLSATSTTAIDTGVCLGTVTTDKDGTTRPQGLGCDRGAYEYGPTLPLPGTPTNFVPVSGASGVDLFPTLSFTSTNATAYDFYFSSFSGQGPATATDLFDRANSTDLGASWTPFTIGFTNAQIVGNRVRNTATTGLESVERFSGSFAADQWARIRLSTFGTGEVSAAIFLRCQNTAQPSGYMIGARKGTAPYTTWAYRYDNGAYTFLGGDSATTWGTNDLLEVHIVGNTLTAYRNGNTDLRLTATDPAAAYASGGQCLYLFSNGLGQLEVDNYEGGDIGPVFIGTFATATYTPPSLAPNTVYYWKAAGRNATGTTTGPVISFSTLGSTATPVGIRIRFKAP